MEKFFKGNPSFRNVYVKGEVSGKYVSGFGHLYFTLKDKNSKVPCIVRNVNRKGMGFEIENGMKLLVTADITIYAPHGKYQLDIKSATDEGLGKLFLAYKQLKKRLRSEGLFDAKFKKELPQFPKRIGVITSKKGSVIHDIVKTVEQQWPYCQVILFPAAVQGPNSKRELEMQIKRADESDMDTLIVARGGGSPEELWSYNEEAVVRAIFNCRTPVISAIGHEDDETLSDLVSDRRASTPTMAASLAIKNREDIQSNINHLNTRLVTFMSAKLERNKKELQNILKKVIFTDSASVYGSKRNDFELLNVRFTNVSNEMLILNNHRLSKIKSSYSIRHPCKIQLDQSKSNLSELKTRLIDAMNSIINNHRLNLDKTTNKFNFCSEKLITSKRQGLDSIKKSYFILNPCRLQLLSSKSRLDSASEKLTDAIGEINDLNCREFDDLKNRFENRSNEIILASSYELNSIRTAPVLKNCLRNYLEADYAQLDNIKSRAENSFGQTIKDNRKDLDFVIDKRIIKNPYLMLERHNLRLNKYEEKLDKINQVIILEKEKREQKSKMTKMIAVIVAVFIIIILLLMFGGI